MIREKADSVAAVSRHAQESPTFYDKKIVYMGDLGGSKDKERTEEVRNIFKELNSEGIFSRPVSVKTQDYDTIMLELIG